MRQEINRSTRASFVHLDSVSVRNKVATTVDACTVAPHSRAGYEKQPFVVASWPAQFCNGARELEKLGCEPQEDGRSHSECGADDKRQQ
jgi:hypothetical protein